MVSVDGTIRALGNKSGSFCEAVNCEQSEQEGKFLLRPYGFRLLASMVSVDGTIRALGNKSGSFCEAVNCEQSEQEGKFLFATLWFPAPGIYGFSGWNHSSIGEQKRKLL